MHLYNLVPRAFPLNGWGPPYPFFKGKALGTRLAFIAISEDLNLKFSGGACLRTSLVCSLLRFRIWTPLRPLPLPLPHLKILSTSPVYFVGGCTQAKCERNMELSIVTSKPFRTFKSAQHGSTVSGCLAWLDSVLTVNVKCMRKL